MSAWGKHGVNSPWRDLWEMFLCWLAVVTFMAVCSILLAMAGVDYAMFWWWRNFGILW